MRFPARARKVFGYVAANVRFLSRTPALKEVSAALEPELAAHG